MTSTEFLEILEEETALTQSQTHQLADVVEEYPYFQAARAIHLKGLKQNHHFSYNAELRKAAAYTTDRRILFDFITSEHFNQHQISAAIKNRNAEEEHETFDEAVKMNISEANRVLDPELFKASEKKKIQENEEEKADKLEIGQPLEFNKKESHSFSEWLKLTSAKKIDRKEENSSQNQDQEVSKKFELIDNFIANNPKIVPKKENSSKEVKLADKGPSNQLMTETLARVYLEQKNYSKAIQAYKILILKNPEKSGLFADRIEEIKKLQENKTQ